MLTKEDILFVQNRIKSKTIGIIGDFCLDIYWDADMTKSELSRETPHFPLPVVSERFYPGAGGNAANNISALAPGGLCALFLYGEDWRGNVLLKVLGESGINTDFAVSCSNRFTNAYCKPMRRGISETVYEDPRIDFDNHSPVDTETENRIIASLRKMAESVDILCVSDQFKYGTITEEVRREISSLAQNGLTVIVDSRYNIAKYSRCILKPNEVECWRGVYGNDGYLSAETEDFKTAAELLAQQNESTVFCTLGSRGSYITDGKSKISVSAKKARGEIDICGAGDTSLSAFTCALAAGLPLEKAAEFAGAASYVTIHKIGVTGTASFGEIINAH